mgnify:CR=1 FL=1
MKTFAEFQEGVASLALKGGSKLIPALMTGIGAAGTIMQARRVKKKRKIENEWKNIVIHLKNKNLKNHNRK